MPLAMLLADFVTRHRLCGPLTGDATEPGPDGYMLSGVCSRGVVFLRWVTREEAERELVLSISSPWRLMLPPATGHSNLPPRTLWTT